MPNHRPIIITETGSVARLLSGASIEPMMPVVAGEASTRRQILFYAVLLLPLSVLPWLIGGTGAVYGIAALLLSAAFVLLSLRVGLRRRAPEGDRMKPEKQLFGYSVIYLFALFAALVADRWLVVQGPFA